jgi:hypothetical protein
VPDRAWEWAVLRAENGTFDVDNYVDLEAREKWFFQAQIESPAMFARAPGAGSLYWLCARDQTGAYLDGGRTYKLSVPLPVPDKLFWSITVYDAQTRAELVTDQNLAALRSLSSSRRTSSTTRPEPTCSWSRAARRRPGPLDQDHTGPRLVRLLPDLRT